MGSQVATTSQKAGLRLTYAGVDYLDRLWPLRTGAVAPSGIELDYITTSDVGDLFRRMAQHAEFDVAEMSMSTLMLMISESDDRLIGIPAFPSRSFRHSQVYVHAESHIKEPADLAGRNVGVPEYQMTSALWVRAFLQHDFGVTPDQLHWWTGGLKTGGYAERRSHKLPPNIRLDYIPPAKTLETMLDSGDLEALITANAPEPFKSGTQRIRRLFPDYREVEEEYYRRTKFFPIMHTLVVRREVYEANPWVSRALLDAFEEAKQLGNQRLLEMDSLAIGHPWITNEIEEMFGFFGGDPFVFGVKANWDILNALTSYSFEQGLSSRKLDPLELFARETWDWVPGEL